MTTLISRPPSMTKPTKQTPTAPTTALERRLRRSGHQLIAGVDEAGRGALAGPVVAAAVILPERPRITGVADSKALSPSRRDDLADAIRTAAVAWAVGLVSAEVIDATDILRATHAAMRSALGKLDPPPEFIIIDGRPVPGLPAPHEAVVGGDRVCYSVSAASILAKVHRDDIMTNLADRHPGYGFEKHKGYGTAAHRDAIANLGPCPAHRMTFEPLKSLGQATLDL